MTEEPRRHPRLLLDLRHAASDPAALAAVLGLARLLELDPLGIFVEDEDVFCLAGLPFAREICLPMSAWRALDPARLAAEMADLGEQARRAFERASAELGRPVQFARLRGDPGALLADQAGAADIIALAATAGPAGLADAAMRRLEATVLGVGRTVLMLPPRLMRTRGPVAAVISGSVADELELAIRVAVSSGERLLLLSAASARETAEAVAAAEASGMAAARIAVRALAAPTGEAILAGLAGVGERLLVLPRARAGDRLSLLAAARGVPVLAVEPRPWRSARYPRSASSACSRPMLATTRATSSSGSGGRQR